MKLLMDFHWPGNVRELENIIQRGVTLSAETRSTSPTFISIAALTAREFRQVTSSCRTA